MSTLNIRKKSKTIIILLICVTSYIRTQGQSLAYLASPNTSNIQESNWENFKYDFGSILGGVGFSYTRPKYWNGKQWATLGAVTASTGLLYLIDEETSEFHRRQKESIPMFIRDYGSKFGSPQYNYMLTGGVYMTGLLTKNEKLRRTGVLLVASATSAGLLQQLTKSLVGRARPISGKSKDTFDPFNSSRNFHSFPSGHAILAFTNAYAIAKQFENSWIKAGIYTIGLIPGVSRLWDGQHWLTDVVFGVAISIFTVESIDRYLDGRYKEKFNQQSKKVSWNLNFGPGKVGIVAGF